MIGTPEFWYKKNISSKVKIFLLFPFSIIWILISYIKKIFIKKYKSNLKVICIGNLTIGGTGKTPFAIYIYKILKNFGYKPVFLTRGYKGLLKGPVEVKDTHNFETVGDEAILLSKIGPTIVSKDRSFGARFIENHEENFNIIIMDDGLQNYQLEQDIKFLLVDKNLKFGNEYCIPAGPLREPVNQGLKKIDALILTGNNYRKDTNFKNINMPIFNSETKIIKSPKIKKEGFLAFCGLANPNKFYELLKENGQNVISTKSFPDHYVYKSEDIDNLKSEADDQNLKLITTEKDYVKINDVKNNINVLPIEMEINMKEKAVFKTFLKEKLNV